MSNDKGFNGIRLQGESDRSEEFRTARDAIIADANSLLDTLRATQAEGRSTKVGILGNAPRIQQTSLGNTGPNLHLLATEYTPGAALYQQYPEKGGAYVLESIIAKGDEIEVTHVSGTTEFSRSLQELTGPVRSSAHGEIVASFGVENISDERGTSYYRYDFMGDGRVQKHFIDLVGDRGTNKGIPVSTVEGLEMAQLALDDIKQNIV